MSANIKVNPLAEIHNAITALQASLSSKGSDAKTKEKADARAAMLAFVALFPATMRGEVKAACALIDNLPDVAIARVRFDVVYKNGSRASLETGGTGSATVKLAKASEAVPFA